MLTEGAEPRPLLLVNAEAIKNKRLRTMNPSGRRHSPRVQASTEGDQSPGPNISRFMRKKKEAGEKRLDEH